MRCTSFLRIIVVFLIALPACAVADAVHLAETIQHNIEYIQSTGDTRINGDTINAKTLLAAFYERRYFQPAWEEPAHIRAMIRVVKAAEAHGLTPAHYHLAALEDMASGMPLTLTAGKQHDVNFDMLLTDSFFLLAHDLASGRVDPSTLNPAWNFTATSVDEFLGDLLETALDDGQIQDHLDGLAPAHPLYRGMRAALVQYRELAVTGGWMPIPEGTLMAVGVRDERVPLLRERLRQTGDLSIATDGDPLVFDETLSRAVLRFQERTRVSRESRLVDDADGAVGEETLTALNTPVQARIQQLRANLERCRWLLRDLPATYVLVDMAGYRGYFYKDDDIIWRARVQIGTPYNATPSFRSTIKYIVFNPTWTVPPGIMRDVTLPRIRKDPDYLAKQHLQVFDRDGRLVDPATVDWSQYSAANLPYRIVQTPGPHNAVGRVKFIFPNPYYIYLHDTPHKTEFGLDQRAYSAGCIRIDKPYKLAKRLLDGPEKWTMGRIWDIVDSGKTQTVFLPEPVPVLITYLTAQVDDQGQLQFRKDVYKRDAALLQSLDAAPTAD